MNDVELIGLMDKPLTRRLWLLYNASQCLRFDRAIEVARTAEAFVTGSAADTKIGDTQSDAETPTAEGLERTDQLIEETSHSIRVADDPTATQRPRLNLSAGQRDRLLGRLAKGARNAELATEFGLSRQQVQGLRIGCAREIAKLRDQPGEETAHADQPPSCSTPIEEIIRYLRQQDDVVVPQGNGEFLVNGRFHMPLADLVERANRMRNRQRKPAFELIGENRPGG